MSRPFTRLCWLRALTAAAVPSLACAGPGLAQQPSAVPRLARQLLEQSPSVLSPLLWLDAAKALAGELGVLGEMLTTAANSLRERDGLIRGVMAALTLAALGIAIVMAWRWWQRRIVAPVSAPSHFAKALASTGVFLRIALTAPLAVLAAIEVLEAFALLPERWAEIAYGLGLAVAVAAFGGAVAGGVLAPDAPWRRLIAVDDAAAKTFARHLVWGARALGVLLFLLVVHKVLDAPVVLTVATNMLFASVVGGLLLHLLLSLLRSDAHAADEAQPRALWLRTIAWLIVAAIVMALVTGYSGFAAFLAERLLSTIAVLGVLYLLLVLTHAALVEWLAADTPKGRAIAAALGVNPRRLGLIASLLSGGICLLLIVGALVLVIGPLEVTPADFGDTLHRLAFGFRIGELNVSFAAVFAAAVILLVALIVTRALQSWLERQILPRTELEPSLQQSIAAIFGYVFHLRPDPAGGAADPRRRPDRGQGRGGLCAPDPRARDRDRDLRARERHHSERGVHHRYGEELDARQHHRPHHR